MDLPLKRWETREADPVKAEAVARELDLPRPLGAVLVGRGYDTADSAAQFLSPRLAMMSDPFDLPGMAQAVEAIWPAIEQDQQIVIYGDYDADGVTSTCLVASVIQELGGRVSTFLPDRVRDGYGLSEGGLQRCMELLAPALVVTVDCGIGSHEAVALARKAGVPVVVTDHHELTGPVVDAEAVVNPKLGDDEGLKSLAGVGVAFKLCHGLVKAGLKKQVASAAALDLRKWLDLVAIGTVADIVPLVGENRILVRHGLARLGGPDTRPGLAALIKVADIRGSLQAYHIGFMLAPRLNAAGRLGSADPALELLSTDDVSRAGELASRLDAANRERKRIEDVILTEATDELDSSFDPSRHFGVVVGKAGWHPGTIGIVASRLCSIYSRPSVVIAFDENGHGKGSCRSIDPVDLMVVIEGCSEHLQGFGGHRMAAGLVIEAGDLEGFRSSFNEGCASVLQGQDCRPVQVVDAWLQLQEVDGALLKGIDCLRPVGMGNPTPNWGVRGVSLAGEPRRIGKKQEHLKMAVVCGGTALEAIAFGMGQADIPQGKLDIVFQLQENTFRGRTCLQMNVKDMQKAAENS